MQRQTRSEVEHDDRSQRAGTRAVGAVVDGRARRDQHRDSPCDGRQHPRQSAGRTRAGGAFAAAARRDQPVGPVNQPRELFRQFAARPHCVWLDTATGGGKSILAAEPTKIFRAKNEPGVFERFRAELKDFPGYAIGYFGYDLKNQIERLPATAVDDLGLPECWFGFYENVSVGHAIACHRDPCAPLAARNSVPYQREGFIDAVLRAKEYIAAGDIYQVNLSQRFQCEVAASPLDVYLALRDANPAPYCAYLDIGEAQILSSSPECFLKINDRHVVRSEEHTSELQSPY